MKFGFARVWISEVRICEGGLVKFGFARVWISEVRICEGLD